MGLGCHSPDLNTPIALLRFRRQPAMVCSKPFDLLTLLQQMRPSSRQTFHQPKLPLSAAQNSPPSWIPSQPRPVARLLQRHFPGHPPWRGAPARVAQCLCPDNVGALQNFLLCTAREPCPSPIHAPLQFGLPTPRFARAANGRRRQRFRRSFHSR